MTIQEALAKYPNIESDLLLAHALNKPKEFLYMHPTAKVTLAATTLFERLAKRRVSGEPIAYILGYKFFHGLQFSVTKDVLIPRPETEWLVDTAAQIILSDTKSKIKKVLDIGTGSGCIAISIAKSTKSKSNITASDVSTKALAVAKKNARLHKAKVKFIHSNLFKSVPGTYDLIIANLPYVPEQDYKKLRDGLLHEPKLALSDGTDEFILLQEFIAGSAKHLTARGVLLMEIDPKAKAILTKAVKKYLPACTITFSKDLHGLIRYAQVKPI